MELVRIGKIVNTHGIKGELRILSDFEFKDKVFKKGVKVYVGKKKKEFIINSYRFHKIFDMVTFEGFNNINDVEYLKGDFVYVNEEDLNLKENEILKSKLIGFDVIIDNENIGKITEIFWAKANDVIRVNENILIPYVDEFIEKIDKENKIITTKDSGEEGVLGDDCLIDCSQIPMIYCNYDTQDVVDITLDDLQVGDEIILAIRSSEIENLQKEDDNKAKIAVEQLQLGTQRIK